MHTSLHDKCTSHGTRVVPCALQLRFEEFNRESDPRCRPGDSMRMRNRLTDLSWLFT
jgi:hypothetical protein